MIIGVAIKHGDLVIALPKPYRHHDCINHGVEMLELNPPIGHKGQGFYLDTGEYLNRQDALEYAKKHHSQTKYISNIELFSEDLW